MDRPLLLIDVDGPLNPYEAKPTRRPAHYETYRFLLRGCRPTKPYRVWLRPDHGTWLLDLAQWFELVWCTAWQDEADKHIAPILGLPPLPWIAFPGSLTGEWIHHGWKYPGVAKYAKDRPLAWVDDDFGAQRLTEAREAFLVGRGATPTKLHHVDPKLGLLPPDIDALKQWAASLT
jgi:hypothetical protein